MWLSQQQTSLTELIQTTIVQLCREHVPFESRLELDGLICISSDTSGAKQLVVKIHQVVEASISNDAERITKSKAKFVHVPFTAEAQPLCLQSSNATEIVEMGSVNGIRRAINARPVSEAVVVPVTAHIKEPLIVSSEGQIHAWKQRAPQILKLLTKSEQSANTRNQLLLPTDLSLSATNGIKANIPAIAKKELPEDKVEDLTIGTLHSGNKWRCKICHLHCSSFNELELHMRSEHVRFVCRLCLNSFTLSCNLRRHMKLHAGVRPHICLHCNATFSRSTDLKIHMKKHADMNLDKIKDETSSAVIDTSSASLSKTGILHECDICNKGFATASHLADHRQTHGVLAMNQENSKVSGSNTDIVMYSEGDKTTDSDPLSSDQLAPDNQTLDLSNSTIPNADSDAMDYSVDLSVKIPKCVSDLNSTGHNFTPVLDHTAEQKQNVSGGLLNCSFGALNSIVISKALTSRSKRKGMPVKRMDAASDDNDELSEDDTGTVAYDALSVGEREAISTTDDVMNKEAAQSPSLPVPCSPSQCTNNDEDESNGQPHTEMETKIYSCQWAGGCNTSWCGFAAYEKHYTSAHGGRFPCSLCSQSFTSRNNRRRHADGHAGSPGSSRHQCPTCGKQFSRADISKEHRLTHTRSYRLGKCVKCGETGGGKRSSLLVHLKRCLAHVDIDNDVDEADSKSLLNDVVS